MREGVRVLALQVFIQGGTTRCILGPHFVGFQEEGPNSQQVLVETSIGVFSSRSRAEEAVRELLQKQVPEEAILFLTRSETDAKTIAKQFGATVGGFAGGATGLSAGVIAATLLIPGVGPAFALGLGAAALLGLTGASAGATVGKAVAHDHSAPQPTPDDRCTDEATFFREVLRAGRSLIVVRTESKEVAHVASEILDRTGLSITGPTPVPMQANTRTVEDVAIIDVTGRITIGDGSLQLREVVGGLIDGGSKKVLLNLHGVGYIDSSGLGELVRTYTSVRNRGGNVKLVNPSKRVHDLLHLTHMAAVFDVHTDEASAIQSFASGKPTAAA
jgi:anti-sigma B factor antagonist